MAEPNLLRYEGGVRIPEMRSINGRPIEMPDGAQGHVKILPSQEIATDAARRHGPVYCRIQTPEGSGQTVHPSVVYIPGGFGDRLWPYWMAITPFPGSDNNSENPCIYASYDGIEWEVPQGLTNPLVPTPGGSDVNHFNSDPDMLYHSGQLWLYYRETDRTVNPTEYKMILLRSYDGVTWSSPQQVILSTTESLTSLTIIHDGTRFVMWFVDSAVSPRVIKRKTSLDGVTWSSSTTTPLSGLSGGRHPWHIDVYRTDDGVLHMPLQHSIGSASQDSRLGYARSIDGGTSWTVVQETLFPRVHAFERDMQYRATWFPSPILPGVWDMWYSGYTEEIETDKRWLTVYQPLLLHDGQMVPMSSVARAKQLFFEPVVAPSIGANVVSAVKGNIEELRVGRSGFNVSKHSRGSNADRTDTGVVDNELTKQVNASTTSRAGPGGRAQVNASQGSTASGGRSQVNASVNSVASATFDSQVNASYECEASGVSSQVNASRGSTASGSRSQVNASDASQATGPQSVVSGSVNSVASGQRAAVIASEIGTAAGNYSTVAASRGSRAEATMSAVLASRATANAEANSVAGGYAVGDTPSTANRTWEIHSINGTIKATGAITGGSTFSDYGEFFPNALGSEIPLGVLVTLDGDGVRPAVPGDDVIGVVSGTAGVVLGDTPFHWQGRYLTGDFGEPLYEEIPDPAWEPAEGEAEEDRPLIRVQRENPDYDPTLSQVPRSERPDEWTLVGMLGQVYVRIDSDVAVGDYLEPGPDGVAVAAAADRTNLRVMRITQAGIAYCLLR